MKAGPTHSKSVGCVEEVATSVKRIFQQTCPISAVPCSSFLGTLLTLHDPIITVVRGGCSIGWFVDDYRCVCGLLLVRGDGGKRLFVPHTNDYTFVCGTNTCMMVTDYFFCVRPSIGHLRWRSKHLGGGALFPLIPSKIPVGAVEERNRRAESFCHV